MAAHGYKVTSELRDIAILIVLGIVMTWAGLSCDDCEFNTRKFWIMASFTSAMWVILWKGNDYMSHFFNTRISWIEFPIKRFFVGFIGTIAFTLGAMYGLSALYTYLFQFRFSTGVYFSVMITIIISLFMHGRGFLLNWRQTAIDAEKLQKENMAARYESLKNQVNPHFLFNSLNALTNLVYEDQEKAVKFIKQLSEVYRYVLDTRDKEVVPLSAELKFLESYVFLQRIRFGQKLTVEVNVHEHQVSIAPLALQMLIENAIKHNIVSEDDPLHIRVYNENGFIVVENNLQKKTSHGEDSSGVGLENICRRYEFLTAQKVIISEDAHSFKVKIPQLTQPAS